MRIALQAFLTFFVLSLSLACDGPKEISWKTLKSPSGQETVEIRYLEPFGFGSHDLRFYHRGDRILQKSLRNDGKVLGEHNMAVEWKSESELKVTLKGEEQKDESITIKLQTNP